MKLKNSFHPYAIVTIIFWSLAYVLTRLTLQYFTAFSLGFIRYFIASCALIIIAIIAKTKIPDKKDFLWFALAGFVGFFIYMIAFNHGQATVTSATGSVIIATVPLITALFAGVIYHEKLKLYQWFAIIIEFIGVIVLTLINGAFSINSGIFWLLIAALALTAYNLLQRRLTKKYTALQSSTYSILFGTCMLAVFSPTTIKEIQDVPPVQYIYLAILGICSSAIAYVAWAKAFSKAKKTSQVSNYMFITPFLASVFGFIFANEIPDRATIIGGSIILVGVLIFNFGEKFLTNQNNFK